MNRSGNATTTPRAVIGAPRRGGQVAGARSVSSYVPRLTRKAFEKYGFATAALLTDWATIVGADIASFTAPERLKWPRDVNAYGDVEDGMQGRPGATLVIRVEGARALELQHKRQQLIERINAMFGYRAIADVRFIQAPIDATGAPRRARLTSPARQANISSPDVAAIQDEALKAALANLESHIRSQAK